MHDPGEVLFISETLCYGIYFAGKQAHVIKERVWDMRKTVLLASGLLAFILFCLIAALVVNHFLNLPFRSTNDALHEKKSSYTLDFLIPAGTHIDDKTTIREVIRIRTAKKTSTYEGMLQAITEMVPNKFLYMADLILFLLWAFLFMTVLRVFTFVGYRRALRISLLLAASVYYFMPDLSPGRIDDGFFILVAVLIIALRVILKRRKKKKARENESPFNSMATVTEE